MILREADKLRPIFSGLPESDFALAAEARTPQKAAKLPVAKDASLDDAFVCILQSGLQHLRVNQTAVDEGGDPEGLHQVRVALRRLRSALKLIGRLAPSRTIEDFQAQAKSLASNLSDARNWDVFVFETLPKAAKGCSAVDGFDALRHVAMRVRGAEYEHARAVLPGFKFRQFQIALGEWIERRSWRNDVSGEDLAKLTEPASDFAVCALDRMHRKVLKRGRRFKTLTPKERHKIRLRLKKLRDAADFFLPVFDEQKTARRYTRELSHLQDCLGAYNDMVTTAGLMASLADQTVPPTAGRAIGAIAGWQARGQICLEGDLRAAWRDFRKTAAPS